MAQGTDELRNYTDGSLHLGERNEKLGEINFLALEGPIAEEMNISLEFVVNLFTVVGTGLTYKQTTLGSRKVEEEEEVVNLQNEWEILSTNFEWLRW